MSGPGLVQGSGSKTTTGGMTPEMSLLIYVDERHLKELEGRVIEILVNVLADCKNSDKIDMALAWISSPDAVDVPEPVKKAVEFLERNELYRDDYVLHNAQANMTYAYYLTAFLENWSKDREMIDSLKAFACRDAL